MHASIFHTCFSIRLWGAGGSATWQWVRGESYRQDRSLHRLMKNIGNIWSAFWIIYLWKINDSYSPVRKSNSTLPSNVCVLYFRFWIKQYKYKYKIWIHLKSSKKYIDYSKSSTFYQYANKLCFDGVVGSCPIFTAHMFRNWNDSNLSKLYTL